ncbi:hypothetical protein BO94DRAFT_582837 [Aspergillus sclerotioniger CBS 115572]|uniref:Uncharacterized protein n=1 Tax=Aspergillus sclerotioniger CBS 115572 TaxID=1450535 RepID=A0A317X550_9EURO|nr:hypothetical protein BO94DRAFT_582837 [Aspergillus sclerotioniger CBS 115572]PWY93455.1 hypothetical protein BO94DRAFT_582837 [Aspergillus sclerotioniger CBS 115572]
MGRQCDYARDTAHPDRRMRLAGPNQSVASTWLASRFMIDAPGPGPGGLGLPSAHCTLRVGERAARPLSASSNHDDNSYVTEFVSDKVGTRFLGSRWDLGQTKRIAEALSIPKRTMLSYSQHGISPQGPDVSAEPGRGAVQCAERADGMEPRVAKADLGTKKWLKQLLHQKIGWTLIESTETGSCSDTAMIGPSDWQCRSTAYDGGPKSKRQGAIAVTVSLPTW